MSYPENAILLKAVPRRKHWLIGKRHTAVAILVVCCTKKQLEAERSGGEEEMSVYKYTSSMTVPSGEQRTGYCIFGGDRAEHELNSRSY